MSCDATSITPQSYEISTELNFGALSFPYHNSIIDTEQWSLKLMLAVQELV